MFVDLKIAARRLWKTPFFTLFAVLSLGIGVGVTTAVYAVVDAIFLKDLGIRDPSRVVFLVRPGGAVLMRTPIPADEFDRLRPPPPSLDTISASAQLYPVLALPTTTEVVVAEAVDGSYFSTLGVGTTIGRVIQPSDDAEGARVVVLSHALWRQRFGASPGVVGQTVRVAGRPFDVIGVASPSFDGAGGSIPGTKIWIPRSADATAHAASSRKLVVFGRLKPSATVARAGAELAAVSAQLDRETPLKANFENGQATRSWTVRSAADIDADGNPLRRFGLTLVALVALVLVVACTNLSNLVLARGTTRQQELTIRHALGASRWRLVREQCAESLLLAFAGGAASFVVVRGLRALMNVDYSVAFPFGGRWTLNLQPPISVGVVVAASASLLLSMIVFGLEPALQLTRESDLRGELASTAAGTSRARRQQLLLRWQVAIAAAFFIIATMFIKYTVAEARHDSGVDLDGLGVAVVNFNPGATAPGTFTPGVPAFGSFKTQPQDEARVRRTIERVFETVQGDAAVAAAAASVGLPFGVANTPRLTISLTGARDDASYPAVGIAATPGIFRTLGVPILRGRGFDDRDEAGDRPVAVISEFTARQLFGTADAIGRQFVMQPARDPTVTVIGVARNTDVRSILADPQALVYMPLGQRFDSSVLAFTIRSSGRTASAVRALRTALRRADPDLAVDGIGTGRTMLAAIYVFLMVIGMSAFSLGAVTLLLAMAGLFGIQSHIVGQRTKEIGVRMSLGASAAHIKWMVLRDGYRPVVEGLGLGVFGGLAGRAIVRARMEIDMAIVDPWMVIAVPIPLIVAAFCACYFPARRAASVDPNVALKQL
ncbi:MAG TPA: ABC transporter permease [Vicinamibacterales bacterium]|nr:ABC transporter permease [Vicinamibacterales bacterium]